jgi:hypothetical protein
MIDIVPVGAIVVTVEFLLGALSLYIEPSNIGNAPLIFASLSVSATASSLIVFITFSAKVSASSESYGIPSSKSISAQPPIPSPILLIPKTVFLICSKG